MQYNTSSDWFVNYLYLAHSSYKCMYEHERACALNEPLIQTYLVSVHDEKPFRSFDCIASGGGILWWGIDVKSAWGQYCWGTRLATLDLSTLLFICPKTGRLVRFLFRHTHSTGSSKSSPLHRDRNRIKLIPHLHRHSYATFVVRPKNTSPTHPWPGYLSKSSHAVIYFHINPGTK